MYRFVASPRWLVGHVVVAALVVFTASLGFWQLRRLDERRTFNETVRERAALPVASVDEALALGPQEAEWRRVEVRGRFDPVQEVLVRNRAHAGQGGYHVLTPLLTDDGRAVGVNRGWVPLAGNEDEARAAVTAPSGDVTVVGRLRPSQVRHTGPRDPSDGVLHALARVDLDRLRRQLPYDLAPMYVELEQQSPAQPGDLPVPVAAPTLTDGPHLSYAGQWFLFSALEVVGWVVLIRKSARRRASPEPALAPS